MSIFVSIISYKDLELVKTIKSLLHNAKHPKDLHFGVVSQHFPTKHPDLSFVKNLQYIKMTYTQAKGAGYARKLAMDLYNGEDYFLQLDSHMRFAENWDEKLLSMYSQAKNIAKTDKIILSQFPAPYEVHTGGKDYYPKGDKDYWSEPSWTSVVNTWAGVWAGQRMKMQNKDLPHKSHTVLAAYIFAPGKIVYEVPYDERICFMGEELCFAIRAYTRGWEIYAPQEMLMWHFYNRRSHTKVWNQREDQSRIHKWIDLETLSAKTQKSILTNKETGIYGIGDYQKYLEYQKMIGIDFNEFYNEKIQEKINNSVLEQEIIFNDSTKQSRYCIKNMHQKCETKYCECKCHKEIQ